MTTAKGQYAMAAHCLRHSLDFAVCKPQKTPSKQAVLFSGDYTKESSPPAYRIIRASLLEATDGERQNYSETVCGITVKRRFLQRL